MQEPVAAVEIRPRVHDQVQKLWTGFATAEEVCPDADENVLIQELKPMQESVRSRRDSSSCTAASEG